MLKDMYVTAYVNAVELLKGNVPDLKEIIREKIAETTDVVDALRGWLPEEYATCVKFLDASLFMKYITPVADKLCVNEEEEYVPGLVCYDIFYDFDDERFIKENEDAFNAFKVLYELSNQQVLEKLTTLLIDRLRNDPKMANRLLYNYLGCDEPKKKAVDETFKGFTGMSIPHFCLELIEQQEMWEEGAAEAAAAGE